MSAPVVLLLTGAAGFVGREILAALQAAHPDWTYAACDIQPAARWPAAAFRNTQYLETDVQRYDACLAALQRVRPRIVLHAAGVVPQGLARYSRANRDAVFALNVGGTANMLRAARACGVPAFLFTGSCTSVTDDLEHDYPNFSEALPFPASALVYGESKARAEELVLAANGDDMATCSLRPSTILGREDYQLVPSIQACIAKFETPFVIGGDDNLYDFTYVENVAQAHVLAVENLLSSRTAAGEAILISNDQPITFRDFMLAIWAHWDHVPPFSVTVPARLAWFAGYVAEWHAWLMGKPTTLCRGSVKDAIGTRYCSQEKAQRILGYHPKVDLWDGLKISCDALKKRLAEKEAADKKGQ